MCLFISDSFNKGISVRDSNWVLRGGLGVAKDQEEMLSKVPETRLAAVGDSYYSWG